MTQDLAESSSKIQLYFDRGAQIEFSGSHEIHFR